MKYLSIPIQDFKGWSGVEYAWLFTALVVVAIGSYNASLLEFSAALTNVLCVILVAKGRLSNYYWGLAGVILYAIVAYNAQLYGNAMLNVIYIPLQFIGFYQWNKNLQTREYDDVEVKRLSTKNTIALLGIGAMAWFAVSFYLSNYTDDANPILDGFTVVASLIAMWLLIKQYPEQWILWIIVNIVTVYLWVIPALDQPGSWAIVAQWSVFLANSIYGAYKWYVVIDRK